MRFRELNRFLVVTGDSQCVCFAFPLALGGHPAIIFYAFIKKFGGLQGDV